MAKRKIIKISEKKCNGCAECIPNCPEGAIQIIDGKARLISDLFCDGLGACLGHCPQGAITIEEREAQAYAEDKVMENIVKQGVNVIKAHLEHLRDHNEEGYLREALDYLKKKKIPNPMATSEKAHLHSGCPGSKLMEFQKNKAAQHQAVQSDSELVNWPVQLMLVPAFAPFLNNADILISADCVPFAYANFHADILKGKVLIVACPKLDDLAVYVEKIKQMLKNNNIKSITYAHMEVPCCFGLINVIKEGINNSGKEIPFHEVVIGIKGEKLS